MSFCINCCKMYTGDSCNSCGKALSEVSREVGKSKNDLVEANFEDESWIGPILRPCKRCHKKTLYFAICIFS